MTKTERIRCKKYPKYQVYSTVSSKFSSVSSYNQTHILRCFHWLLMLKFQSATKFFKNFKLIPKKINSLYSNMVANVFIKFVWDRVKTVGRVVIWNLKSHMVLCEEKCQNTQFVYDCPKSNEIFTPCSCVSKNSNCPIFFNFIILIKKKTTPHSPPLPPPPPPHTHTHDYQVP